MSQAEVVDVVVVGAGVSGLTSAYHLKQKNPNLKVVVLEAKDRVGGRTVMYKLKAAHDGYDFWDFGGQWIGACQPHVMAMAKDLNLEVYPQYTDGKKVMQVGDYKVRTYISDIPSLTPLALIDLQWTMSKLERWRKMVPNYDPSLCVHAEWFDGMTMEEALRTYGWTNSTHDVIASAFRCIFGVEPSELSLLYFLSYCSATGGLYPLIESKKGSGQEFKIKGGAAQIAHLLAKHLGEDVRLGQPVLSIVQNEVEIIVTTLTGLKFSCSRVVMATPPNQTIKMEFQPMLPTEKLHVLQNMPIGYITKIIITYEKAFWREAGFSGEVVTNGGRSHIKGVTSGPLCICYDATSSNGNPALVAFIGGKQQREYNLLSAKERQYAVIQSLSSFFGSEVENYLDYREKDWGLEPYTGGGPVCVGKPGMMTTVVQGLRKPFGRMHFAGTESATEWCGFINGAIQAGYRAANEVLYNLNPSSVTGADLVGTYYDPARKEPRPMPSRWFGLIPKVLFGFGFATMFAFLIRKCF